MGLEGAMTIQANESWPIGFKDYMLDNNIELKDGNTLIGYYRIVNKSLLGMQEKVDTTNWLLAAAGKYPQAGTISDWLKAEKDTLYLIDFQVFADKDVDVKVKNPSATQLFGSLKNSNFVVTPGTGSVLLYSWDDTNIPYFEIENNTKYALNHVKLKMNKGMKLQLELITKDPRQKPDAYDRINLGQVN